MSFAFKLHSDTSQQFSSTFISADPQTPGLNREKDKLRISRTAHTACLEAQTNCHLQQTFHRSRKRSTNFREENGSGSSSLVGGLLLNCFGRELLTFLKPEWNEYHQSRLLRSLNIALYVDIQGSRICTHHVQNGVLEEFVVLQTVNVSTNQMLSLRRKLIGRIRRQKETSNVSPFALTNCASHFTDHSSKDFVDLFTGAFVIRRMQ